MQACYGQKQCENRILPQTVPGRLVAADVLDGSYMPAFVPDPLPPPIDWNCETVRLVVQRGPRLERVEWDALQLYLTTTCCSNR